MKSGRTPMFLAALLASAAALSWWWSAVPVPTPVPIPNAPASGRRVSRTADESIRGNAAALERHGISPGGDTGGQVIEVQVVDSVGALVTGISVTVSAASESHDPARFILPPSSRWQLTEVTTEPRAIARFQFPGFHEKSDVPVRLSLVARADHAISPAITIDRRRLSELAQPVRIQLPPRAWIRVKVTDPDGNLIPRPGVWLFHDVTTRNGKSKINLGHPMVPRFFLGEDPRGQFRIAVAANGERWEARATVGPRSFSTNVLAPARAGAEATATIVIPADRPLVRGTVIDPTGQPLADARLRLTLVRSANGKKAESAMRGLGFGGIGGSGEFRAVTDSRGRFWLPLEDEFVGEHLDAIALRVISLAGVSTAARGHAVVRRRLDAAVLQLGVITLVARPLICDGEFQLDGEAVAEGELSLTTLTMEHRDSATTQEWQAAEDLDLVRGDAGRFEVRGTAPPGSLRLSWNAPWLILPGSREVRSGDRGLRVELHRSGTMTLSLLLPPVGHPPANLRIALLARSSSGEQQSTELRCDSSRFVAGPKSAKLTFTFRHLEPGDYTLAVRLSNDPESLAEFSGVKVIGGAGVKDSRLSEIDLRSTIRATTFNVFDSGGRPFQGSVFWLRRDGNAWKSLGRSDGTFLHRSSTLELSMVIRGRRPRIVQATGGMVRIDLSRRKLDELRLRHHVTGLPTGVRAWVEVRSTDRTASVSDVGTIVVPSDLSIPRPMKRVCDSGGELRLSWPTEFPHEFRFFLGRGNRLVPCEATTEIREGVVVFAVRAAQIRDVLGRL